MDAFAVMFIACQGFGKMASEAFHKLVRFPYYSLPGLQGGTVKDKHGTGCWLSTDPIVIVFRPATVPCSVDGE